MAETGPSSTSMAPSSQVQQDRPRLDWLWDILLIAVLLGGAYFRFVGLDWDQNQHLHPDERFLTMVETAIMPVGAPDDQLGLPPSAQTQDWRKNFPQDFSDCPKWGGYFDTSCSSLNPNNRGYSFYVYGTLPLFIVRYIGEWMSKTGYDQIHLVGRQVSAVMDLGTVFLVYLIAVRLFGRRKLALLASAFAALSVLPIQLSHYFTVDTFTNFFGMLAFYFATRVLPDPSKPETAGEDKKKLPSVFGAWASVAPYALFGLALGLAMACKINAALLAVLLPGAVLLRLSSLPADEREQWGMIFLRNLVIAALVSLVIFRIFQPYAFSGPGFFGVRLNPKWLESMRELASQSTGDVDFPPALQWARRPITFALQNMVLWGLGLPLGILAWAGFLWMGYRMLRHRILLGGWRAHLLIWVWTGAYFAYQSYNWTRSMRYQMLVYPTLAVIAAWAVFELWDARPRWSRAQRIPWVKIGAALVGVAVLGLTAAWAFAFTRIYTRPVTRVEASRWIYQNVPGPINLHIASGGGITNQPVAFRSGFTLRTGEPPLSMAFRPRQPGQLASISFEYLGSSDPDGSIKSLIVAVSESPDGANPLAATAITDVFQPRDDPRGNTYSAVFDRPVLLDAQKTYYMVAMLDGSQHSLNLAGMIHASIVTGKGVTQQNLPEPVDALRAGKWYQVTFPATRSGILTEIVFNHIVDWEGSARSKTLRISVLDPDSGTVFGVSEIRSAFAAGTDPRGEGYTFKFPQPVALRAGTNYAVRIEQVDGSGALAFYGSRQANESSWDDALPLGLDGYNPYDYNYGIYRSDSNFELYWDDNADKLQRFKTILNQADYIFISSNRQWGTTTRVPERYPLTSAYYRSLLGCPPDKEITWCYSVAAPGMFQGDLGYELAAVFQSDPNLGSLRFNTQFAEEAFTVYDAPKVLIFRKTAAYDADKVAAILDAVDLTRVIHVTPRKASLFPGNLLLPPDRLSGQQAGGTWADLFHPEALVNRYPILAALVWYGVISLLGLVMFPFTRLALRGLTDRGYPFTRLVGMLGLAYPVWLLGSAKVPVSSRTITLVFAGLVLGNLILGIIERKDLLEELRERKKYLLAIELLFLAFFLIFLFVRLGNPDLWHPWKGGEKPMDFSYFNAVLKSTTFPPYDPWFAGGYINYYYYGFVIIGVPVKWLGIIPSIAYNLILPTFFAMLAMGAFSVGWNLLSATKLSATKLSATKSSALRLGGPLFDHGVWEGRGPFFAGLSAALATAVLGNWGTVRMIWHGVQKLADLNGAIFENAPLTTHLAWTFQGLWRLLISPGTRLAYGPADWYWIPSRAIPGEPITEFPAFTFLYADPHAHLIALPITILALGWGLSVLFGRWQWKGWVHLGASFLLGGLVIGALKPTNTWDWPTYLAIGVLAVFYTALRCAEGNWLRIQRLSPQLKRFLTAAVGVVVLIGLSALFYQPFARWYGQGYNAIDPWTGDHTPFWSYMTHWGLFLFVIASWMAWETIDWMATTRVSALNRLRPFRVVIYLGIVLLFGLVAALMIKGVTIAWLVLPMAAGAGILLLRPGLSDAKRAVLFMTGTALALTLFVELFVLRGDIGRMNTVFKFYLQAWTLFALSAGASLLWLLPEVASSWQPGMQKAWAPALLILVLGAALFPLMAAKGKIEDRMTPGAPHTLDGMTYMAYSTYPENDVQMDLSQDYRAIQWMQRSIQGSPVIVEANTGEYHWGNRFTIYTGLPGVVGWNWHQRQQRAVTPSEWVTNRIVDIGAFYNTISQQQTAGFLKEYAVKYIVVGQLERALYSPVGLQKFSDWNGGLWREVYMDGQTAIYEVVQP